jgi:hypothetical protein
MKDDRREELEEVYRGLSRFEKFRVVLHALGVVLPHLATQIPLRWLLFQIRIDMKFSGWK